MAVMRKCTIADIYQNAREQEERTEVIGQHRSSCGQGKKEIRWGYFILGR